MKEIVSGPIGTSQGKYMVKIENGELVAQVSHPVAPVLDIVKVKFVDRLKAIIPGKWDDMLIDQAWNEVIKEVTE